MKTIAPEPPRSLQKDILAQRATLPLAQYMWSNGWKERFRDTVLPWQDFLKIISSRYYRFAAYASRELTWAEIESRLEQDCKQRIEEKIGSSRDILT